ncbi:uncharacterized protein TRAVEDRAFT_38277 [Trametes versicolor FP-101664 SS1]|uniref:uncharacterized protein n=1 Tax=Trametes versicolor (strain FP-101664) TaxID=717944 RepID=UPI0004624133|nr:uncharacterized protein TRAVEDRAFT_38277 [Trametes versicolor FP-101664 SS1]EIW57967.1 hypothetical protein TRAVEDRAFT_38277 [Trametes versicolor FP-101664 SS1]
MCAGAGRAGAQNCGLRLAIREFQGVRGPTRHTRPAAPARRGTRGSCEVGRFVHVWCDRTPRAETRAFMPPRRPASATG